MIMKGLLTFKILLRKDCNILKLSNMFYSDDRIIGCQIQAQCVELNIT